VNISAVDHLATLTSMPVKLLHFGPEKFSGSSACRPASQTMVIVCPLYCWRHRRRSGRGRPPRPGVPRSLVEPAAPAAMPFAYVASRNIPSSLVLNGAMRIRSLSRVSGKSSSEAPGEVFEPGLESGAFQHLAVHHAARHSPFITSRTASRRPHHCREALVGPAQRVGGGDHIVELEERVVGVGRFLLEHASSPAPRSGRPASAAVSAFWSTMGPRAVLMK